MDTLYQKLNKKLDALQGHKLVNHNKETMKHTFHTRIVNLAQIKLRREQVNTLNIVFGYTIEKEPKHHINELIIDTKSAIQNIFKYLAARKIKQIIETNTHNTLHKRHQYNLKN